MAAAVDRAGSAAYQVFLDAVRAAVEEGLVRGSVDDVAVASLGTVHGLSLLNSPAARSTSVASAPVRLASGWPSRPGRHPN